MREETRSVRVLVPPERDAVRLDRFLAEDAGLPSRAFGQKLIREGRVLVDGKTARASRKLAAGETVTITLPPPEPSALVPEAIPLDVRHEDEDLIVVVKPAGMVVHPGAGVRTGTLVHALLSRCGTLSDAGEAVRPGIVHRLDKDTSGLLVAAKTREAHLALSRAIERRDVERQYLAVVWGFPPDKGVIRAPIGRSRRDRKKMAVTEKGKEAVSRFTSRERFLYACLTEVALESGRTHQIRVHFAHAGHPVFGDPEYGGRRKALAALPSEHRRSAERALEAIDRQALHAWRLRFRHPRTGAEMAFEAEAPSDFAGLLSILRREERRGGHRS
ncbi:MAG: RluA family pseudouridine synthase [Candidatus Eisenbacteria bacterium]|nr:RluA family pseudouridine synthase [Candidatus Eisenbacteria bacterium]